MASTVKRTLPNGETRYLVRYRDDSGKQRAKTFPRKAEATRFASTVEVALLTGSYVAPNAGRITLREYWLAWQDRQVCAAATVRARRLAVESTPFVDRALGRIARSDVESWVRAMIDKPLAPATVRQRVDCLRVVLRAAVRDRVIPTDPTEGTSLPVVVGKGSTFALPSPEQVLAIRDACPPDFAPVVLLAAFAGLRIGEVCGLQVGDVDWLRRSVHVRRQVQHVKGDGPTITAPKTKSSTRTVPVAPELLDALAAHVAAYRPGDDSGRWLVSRAAGQPYTPRTAWHVWQQARAAAGAPDVDMHDLRHFYASALIAGGADVVTVQRACGHRSASITLNTYSHLWPSAEDRTRSITSDLMRSVGVCTESALA